MPDRECDQFVVASIVAACEFQFDLYFHAGMVGWVGFLSDKLPIVGPSWVLTVFPKLFDPCRQRTSSRQGPRER
jgi:hypothetical protein